MRNCVRTRRVVENPVLVTYLFNELKTCPYERRYILHKYGDGDARLLAVAMTVNNLIQKT
jgi:hypothetical protein